jgi:hypothetical protein
MTMKRAIFVTMAGALALSACDQSSENTFSPREEDKSAKSQDDGEPRGAAAAAARLAQSREEAGERKAAEDEKSARAFIDMLYGSYTRDAPLDIFGKPDGVFDPQIAAKIKALMKHDEETGDMSDVFGADPICGCQDWGNFSHTIDALTVDGDRAMAKLTVRNFGETTARTITLTRTAAGWRVYDLGDGFRASVLGS